MTEREAQLSEGALVAGRFRVERVLGEGGFGVVYAATEATLDRPVALKLLSNASLPQTALERFRREALALAALPSEHVPTIYEVGDDEGRPFLVMERLRGHDLAREVRRSEPIAVTTAVDWVLEAALGLVHAHVRGIVHRDLKPSNLFLARRADGTSSVKLLDFGIARLDAHTRLTSTGAVVGTTRYMAPEQVRDETIDARADIWALGVVLYELLTKEPIFDTTDPAEFASHIVADPPIALRERRADLPAALEKVVLRCLEKDPSARFSDVGALATALVPFASKEHADIADRVRRVLVPFAKTEGIAENDATVTDAARPARRSRTFFVAFGGTLLVAGTLVVVSSLLRTSAKVRDDDASDVATVSIVPSAPASTNAVPSAAPPPVSSADPESSARHPLVSPTMKAITVSCGGLELDRPAPPEIADRAFAKLKVGCTALHARLWKCYQAAPATTGKTPALHETIHTVIASDGRVVSAVPGNPFASPAPSKCAASAIQAATFLAWGTEGTASVEVVIREVR